MNKVFTAILCILMMFKAHGQNKIQIDNELTFAKVYGYVRYFHPSDEAAGIDWDKFAIYGIKKVKLCPDKETLKQTLLELFLPVAPTLQILNENQSVNFDTQALTPQSINKYKIIAWQHQGIGTFNYKDGAFLSARTNRNNFFRQYSPAKLRGESLLKGINVTDYKNKQFLLKGRARLQSGTGFGHFFARVDKIDKTGGFFDNMSYNLITQAAWKSFEINGAIDSNAQQLRFGVLLEGAGELWIDDVSVSIKEGDSWREIYQNNFNNAATGLLNDDPLSGEKKNTGPEYSSYVMASPNAPLEKWAVIKSTHQYSEAPKGEWKKNTALFKAVPKVGEYIDKVIGSGLKIIMPISLYGDQTRTYPLGNEQALTRLKNELDGIDIYTLTADSLTTRIADIVITWNVFQHFFPYLDETEINWEKDLKDAFINANNDRSAEDFYRTLRKLTAKLKDGHANVSWPKYQDTYYIPISWNWVEDKLVVTGVFDKSLDLKKGDIVTAIDGVNPNDYFYNIKQYISAATIGNLLDIAQKESLLGRKDSSMTLSYKRAGDIVGNVTMKRTFSKHRYYQAYYVSDTLKFLSNNIAYINMGLANMKAINKMLPQLQKSKAIICDFRNCLIDNDNNHFIEYLLTQKDTAAHWMRIAQRIFPDQEKAVGYVNEGFDLKPGKPHIDAKIIFIIDGSVISWAESYMSIIDHYQLGTIIGQPTAGTNGDVNWFTLPGGYTVSFSGLKVTQLDGSRHHGVGTKPHIYVNKTLKGIVENRDEFLEKAIEVASSPQ